ncbi:MAG: DEAD/DEAH box helicase [bacterium]|nr:DEAD/DEAH box helicase [bacterium]
MPLHPRPDPIPTNPHSESAAEKTREGDVVEQWKGLVLSPFQVRAVDAVRRGHNVLVAAPTGAGKTLVAEYAMALAVQRGKRCIYTAPIKALSNQKYRDFRDDPDVDVGIMTGDVTLHATGQVLVMTTEILRNAIFESPDFLKSVEYVIFDEIHYMDDRERGTVWEESLIFLPPEVRLICLSATISNVDQVGAWMDEIRAQKTVVIRDDRRPVPLTHLCSDDEHGVYPATDLERLRKGKRRDRPGRRQKERPHDKNGRRPKRGERGRRRIHERPDPRTLFNHLTEEELLPALVFSFSRRDCERLARANEARALLDPGEQARVEALQEDLIALFQLDRSEYDSDLFQMTRRGVGYHHAGMLPIQKEVVERMFTAGLIKLLFTTETFALGINMPARSAVFYSLRKFDGVSFDWLRTRDYMQMAGRAGRQGIDEAGHVFCLLGSREFLEAPISRLIAGHPEPVVSRFRLSYSTLLHLVGRIGRERVSEAWEKSFHEFQARAENERTIKKHRRDQRRLIARHLAFLDELGYLDGDEVTARGKIARALNGYEVQVTEMLFRGVLENLPSRALAMVFVALIHEERKSADRAWVPARMFGGLRTAVTSLVNELCGLEARHGVEPEMKRPDWGLVPATLSWYGGISMDGLETDLGVNPGDVCRVFRMAVQLMRNVRHAIDPDWDLSDKLGDAIAALNRDEIDARRQLELG